MEEELEEIMEKNFKYMDRMLDLLTTDKNAPIEFKILKARNDVMNISQNIMKNYDFITSQNIELKKTMLRYFEEGANILKEIQNKLEN